MTSTKAPGRPRDAAIDEAILLTTWEQLNTIGYPALTMTAVAEGAGIQKPALYRRWPSKPLLAIDAMAAYLPTLADVDHGSLEADLRAMMQWLGATWSTPVARRSLNALLAEIDDDPEAISAFREKVVMPRNASLRAALTRALDRGELRPDAPLTVVGDLLEGPVMHRAMLGSRAIDDDLLEAVLATCLSLLRT